MGKKIIIIILLCIIILIIFNLYINSRKNFPIAIQTIPVFFGVTESNEIVFVVDTDALKFGPAHKGGYNTRDLIITNPFLIKVRVNLTLSDEIKNVTFVAFNNFILQPNETINVTVKVKPDDSTPVGNYTGYLNVTFYRID